MHIEQLLHFLLPFGVDLMRLNLSDDLGLQHRTNIGRQHSLERHIHRLGLAQRCVARLLRLLHLQVPVLLQKHQVGHDGLEVLRGLAGGIVRQLHGYYKVVKISSSERTS